MMPTTNTLATRDIDQTIIHAEKNAITSSPPAISTATNHKAEKRHLIRRRS
jgi:hypothetical protein